MTSEHDAATTVLERLPQRRPASLYDVGVQYAILDWYQTVTSDELDFDLAPEHLSFLTPRAKDGLYSEDDNALVVYVDLSDPDNPRFRDERPVRLETISSAERFRLGHSYPANRTSNMTDYSVTTYKSASPKQLAGEIDAWWATSTVQDRFTRWAQSEEAQAVIEDGIEDAWIVEALAQLGEDEAALQRLVETFPLDHTDEESEHEAFVTVRVCLPGDERYHWPGEIPVLNEVMVRQKADRFENISVEGAGGQGTGYVSGETTRVTGGSAGLLGMYGKKHREHFSDISPSGEAAWRSRPIDQTTAAALAGANSIFDEFYQPLGEGRRLYVLPYLGAHPERLSPDDVVWFVDAVFDELRAAGDTFSQTVGRIFYERGETQLAGEESDEPLPGLFADPTDNQYEWVNVATAFQVTGNPDHVYFEAVDTDQFRPRQIASAHIDALSAHPCDTGGAFGQLVANSSSPLLNRESRALAEMALFGGYIDWTTEPTRSSQSAQDTPKAGAIDDVRARRLRRLLAGEQLSVEPLLEEYLHQVVQEQRSQFGDDGPNVPARQLVEQYVQLRALQEAGVLDDTTSSLARMQETLNSDYDSRTERLENFIEGHEVLSNPERQAVFLLGGLVGRLSAYQRQNNVSSTLVRRYPIDYITKQSIKEVTNEVLQMNNTYIESDDAVSAGLNARYVDRLPDLMLRSDPASWSFPQSELQWLYALGIAYGTNDSTLDTNDN